MPWTGPSFHRHNSHLSPAQSAHAAAIANHILSRSGNEGMAIATANKLVHSRSSGGMTPSAEYRADHKQANKFRAAEEDAKYMEHVPPDVGTDFLLDMKLRNLTGDMRDPWWTPEMRLGGMIHRDDGGMVPANPAPTPGLQPNAQNQNPMSQSMEQRFSAMSPEQLRELAPRLTGQVQQIAQRILQQKQMNPTPALFSGGPVLAYARGGAPQVHHPGTDREDCVPILAAGGEFVISPHHVALLGEGDVSKGHKMLDAWIVNARKQIVNKMSKLRGPVRE